MKNTVFVVLILFLAGCKSVPTRVPNMNAFGGHLAFSEKGIVNSFFPHSITETTSSRIVDQLYDGLVMLDPVNLEVIPCIAKKWTVSKDGLVYKFNLRTDVYFHDDECFEDGIGRLVNANDIVYTFSLLSSPDENNKNFSSFVDVVEGAAEFFNKGGISKTGNTISGIIAENDSTLVIKLVKPSGVLLYTLANPASSIIPEEGFKKYGYRNHIGCGPYSLSDFNDTSNVLSLRRFPYYFLKDMQGNSYPYADSVTVYLACPLSKSLNMLTRGEINFIQNVPGTDLAGFLELNIARFQSQKPELIAQVSPIMPDWQDVLSSKLVNYHSNNFSMLPLYQMYIKK